MSRFPVVLAVLLVGCTGPLVPGAGGGGGGSSGAAGTTTGTPSPPETGSSPTTGPAVTTAVTTRGSSDSGSTGLLTGTTGSSGDESDTRTSLGSGFIVDPDGGGGCGGFCPSDGVMASCFACSYFDQDCPAGEVCKPADLCNAGTWSRPACLPAPDDANGQPGEPCTAEDSPFSGIDTCAPNSMCFDVDPLTLEGTCTPYCSSYDEVTCEDPTQTCFEGNDGWVSVCLPRCSPLLGDCPAGEGCYPSTADEFVCIPESQPLYTDLNTLHTQCSPGSFMADEEQLGSCPDEGPCCAAFCDLADSGCADGSVCVPFFGDLDGVDPADHTVGFCGPDPG